MISEQYTDDFATYIVSIPFDYSRVPNNRGGGLEISPKTNNRGGGGVNNVHVFFKIFSIKEVHTCRMITKNVAGYLM